MREAFGHHAAGGHSLQSVVSNRSGRLQARFDVALIDDLSLLGGISPDTGKAISLQFQPNRKRIGFLRIALP